MNDSMAQWKTALSWISAVLLGAVFLSSGLWKLSDVQATAVHMAQAKVPDRLSLPAALFFGIAETAAAILILAPRSRRWGALGIGVLLLGFLGYFALNYNALRGADCSCVPWLKRVVGPEFFAGDGILLLLAGIAAGTARRAAGWRMAVGVTLAITLLAGVSYGVGESRQSGTAAPASILVDGRDYSVSTGKVFLFYFDPACMHCFEAAQRMSHLHWGGTRVVGVPIGQPQYAAQFIQDTGFTMAISTDLDKLKRVFPYAAVPAGIALENGREKAALTKFDGEEPAASLKKFGLVY
jgi:uncharacterized membrane protein YphA (DoxX/SURF4 family)